MEFYNMSKKQYTKKEREQRQARITKSYARKLGLSLADLLGTAGDQRFDRVLAIALTEQEHKHKR